MLNSLLLTALADEQTRSGLDPMAVDTLEKPKAYKGWIAPLRYLLAMRYLKHKRRVLKQFTDRGIYPVERADYLQALQNQVQSKSWFGRLKSPKLWTFPLLSLVFYPLLLGALLFGAWKGYQWYQHEKMFLALASRVPFYSELLHQKLVADQSALPERVALLDKMLEQEEQKIIEALPESPEIRDGMKSALHAMPDMSKSRQDIMLAFKAVNTSMDNAGLRFYMSPRMYSSPCDRFAVGMVPGQRDMLSQLQELFQQKDKKAEPVEDGCRTGMVTVYSVTERKRLDLEEIAQEPLELPLYHVKRADRVPAADGALGLTFKENGIGSLILLDQIKGFAEQSVLPALTFQGRPYIIPYWLQGYYDIEESITKNYKNDLKDLFSEPESQNLLRQAAREMLLDRQHLAASRMQQTLQRSTPGGYSSGGVLSGGLDAISGMLNATREEKTTPAQDAARPQLDGLMDSLLPSIEYHEAYHQIDKRKWPKPVWVPVLFDKLSKHGIESSMEELGAYLTQLAYTDSGHRIWLTKLLLFSLNSMTRDQPEYYASSIIFAAMRDRYMLEDINPRHALTVDEKVEIYKVLSGFDFEQMQQLANDVFVTLFERPVVTLR